MQCTYYRAEIATGITFRSSVRTTNDIIFHHEFRDLEAENQNFDFYVTCTRLHPEDAWTGRRGRITAEWVKEHVMDLPNTVFYAWRNAYCLFTVNTPA